MRDWVRTLLIYLPGIVLVLVGTSIYWFAAAGAANCASSLDSDACYNQAINTANLGFGLTAAGAIYLAAVFVAIGVSGSSLRPHLYKRWTGIPWGGRSKLVSEPVQRRSREQK